MVKYQNGKIYKIVSNTDDDICYIGSTTKKYLCQRMENHRNGYKLWKRGDKVSNTSSHILFDKYGIANCRIELIEIFPCNSKDELTKQEGKWIRNLNCVNRYIAGRTGFEWYRDNIKTMTEYHKNYRDVNKSIIAEKGKIKYTCICGSTLRKSDKSRHEKSLKHMNYCASVSAVP
ncbi:hypothetical protein EB118_26265 [bacterium]|nr:hypothetical protein [bacterium]NDG33547.1 hypothetical protein [bacterium]